MYGELPFEALEAHLQKITYKPSWHFHLVPNEYDHGPDVYLMITFHTLDTYSETIYSEKILSEDAEEIEQRKLVKIGMRHRLRGPFLHPDHFERAVLDAIDKCERHETREWLKVDGIMKFDPHRRTINS